MPNPKSLPPPETVAAIRTLFFRRLGETNRDIIRALLDLNMQIADRDQDTCLSLLGDVNNQVQAMRNILMVFEECLGG